MKTALILPIALILLTGCKSNSNQQESENRPVAAILGSPEIVPEDWPITKEEHDFLTYGLRMNALDSKALQSIGLHTRKEIVEFAYRVLEIDLDPIARTMNDDVYWLVPYGAYVLLSHYGSLEDAQKHFDAVRILDGQFSEQYHSPKGARARPMIETLGYYLMRDHFMPQKNRSLMAELEDYLYKCSEANAPSCWPYEGMPGTNNGLRVAALEAMSYSCSERAKQRAKMDTSDAQESVKKTYGTILLRKMESIEQNAAMIRRQLPPVLPEAEIDR